MKTETLNKIPVKIQTMVMHKFMSLSAASECIFKTREFDKKNIFLVHKLKPPTFGFCKTFQLFIGFSKVFEDVKPTSCLNPA